MILIIKTSADEYCHLTSSGANDDFEIQSGDDDRPLGSLLTSFVGYWKDAGSWSQRCYWGIVLLVCPSCDLCLSGWIVSGGPSVETSGVKLCFCYTGEGPKRRRRTLWENAVHRVAITLQRNCAMSAIALPESGGTRDTEKKKKRRDYSYLCLRGATLSSFSAGN